MSLITQNEKIGHNFYLIVVKNVGLGPNYRSCSKMNHSEPIKADKIQKISNDITIVREDIR